MDGLAAGSGAAEEEGAGTGEMSREYAAI